MKISEGRSHYRVTQQGRDYGSRLLELSRYVGPAPVSLEAYRAMLRLAILKHAVGTAGAGGRRPLESGSDAGGHGIGRPGRLLRPQPIRLRAAGERQEQRRPANSRRPGGRFLDSPLPQRGRYRHSYVRRPGPRTGRSVRRADGRHRSALGADSPADGRRRRRADARIPRPDVQSHAADDTRPRPTSRPMAACSSSTTSAASGCRPNNCSIGSSRRWSTRSTTSPWARAKRSRCRCGTC